VDTGFPKRTCASARTNAHHSKQQETPDVASNHLGRVIFWMAGALISFSATALAIRALAASLNIFEILATRTFIGLAIMLGLAAIRPEQLSNLGTQRMGLHLLRNSFHFVGQYVWTLSVTLLPLATVFALEFTMPVWVALLAVLLLGERMTVSRAGSIVLGFLGVLIILRPGLEAFRPAALLVLAGALIFSISLIATKKMLTAGVTTYAIVFWMMVMQLPMALLGVDPLFFLRLDSTMILPVLLIGVTGLTAQYCVANAFHAGDATLVISLDFLRIPAIALVGWLFYAEALDAFVFTGAAVIVIGVVWNLRAEVRAIDAK
jgi:drug/metabolite transporter (DMT)-like permease